MSWDFLKHNSLVLSEGVQSSDPGMIMAALHKTFFGYQGNL
ncbi:hypothetical protein D082_18910 [Synechocystis sp. PCC 6714]|nr:hypothetical protein D082_18910 [Synechocystis sp. PCC 6714]